MGLWPMAYGFLLGSIAGRAQTCNLINEGFEGSNPPAGWEQSGNYFGTFTTYAGAAHAGFNTVNEQLTLMAVDCPGGIEDRFDFIFINDSLIGIQRMNYLANSYKSTSNNGVLFAHG